MGRKKNDEKSLPKKVKSKEKRRSRSERAGLQFPVGRVHRGLRRGYFGTSMASDAPVFLGAVLQYLCTEMLGLSGQVARYDDQRRIIPVHILFAVKTDSELNELLWDVTIPQDESVVPDFRRKRITLIRGSEFPIKIFF